MRADYTLAMVAARWDDPQIGAPLYSYQQKLKWLALFAGVRRVDHVVMCSL